MDEIELNINTEGTIEWRYRFVEMFVNREPLIEIVRRAELPSACDEFDERIAAGDTPDDIGDRGDLAGDYLYLPTSIALPPSQNFFGEPYNHGFIVDDDAPVNSKSLILQCTCGITECWFLLANITVDEDKIIWDNFEQFHRDWTYDIPPLTFDRNQYETAFNRVITND